MKFKTDKSIDDWVENHRKEGCISNATAGEQFVYEFIPTAIGEAHSVKFMTNQKQIFITNGMARSGKDTFAEYLNDFVPTLKYSSIDKVKDIAKQCGWDGTKDEKSRKFLSDLKILTSKVNNMPFRAIKTTVDQFKEDKEKRILLIDIREPKEIEKAKKAFGAKTILIKRNDVKSITSNMADAGVFDYDYDFIIENNGTLDDFYWTVYNFAKENILNDE